MVIGRNDESEQRLSEKQSMYMARSIGRADALTRQDSHDALRSWYAASGATTIGDAGTSASKPWVLVADGGRCYHLDAHTTRRAVAGYLHSVARYGEEIAWATRREGASKRARVVFGPFQLAEHEFQLFAYAS
jgi:hypothetical protein